jgi:hypothetical protein
VKNTVRLLALLVALTTGPGAGWTPAQAPAPADDIDSLFEEAAEKPVEVQAPSGKPADLGPGSSPESVFLEDQGMRWGGEFNSRIGMLLRYRNLPPQGDEWTRAQQALELDLGAKLFFDARPERNYRVFGKFTTSYPYAANSKFFELFADFNWEERVFFRFGKQVAAWGLSRFYQPADPLSVAVKDPQKPADDLEGPLALKVSLPLGPHNLYLYSVAKDSYLPVDIRQAGLYDLGYGLKGDFLIVVPRNPVMSDAELSLGGYYQKNLAPKAVAGISTAVGSFQIFSDQVLAWGADTYRLSAVETATGILGTEKARDGLNYSATAGFLYQNSEHHLTVYGEYFWNGAGSNDPDYLRKLGERYRAEQTGTPAGLTRSLSAADLFAYQSAHNSAFSLALSEMNNTEKLSASLFWQQNWVDHSGLIVPSFIFKPWKYFSLTLGLKIAYGGDQSEFVAKMMDTGSLEPRRLSGFVDLNLGTGKF